MSYSRMHYHSERICKLKWLHNWKNIASAGVANKLLLLYYREILFRMWQRIWIASYRLATTSLSFSSTEAIVISLHYCHAGSAQVTLSGQPSSLEEGPPQRPQAGTKDGKNWSGRAQAALSGQPFGMETEAWKNDDKESSGKERWSKEQIDDFVRKLAFLDAEKEGGDKIKHFLHLNEVALIGLHMFNDMCDDLLFSNLFYS